MKALTDLFHLLLSGLLLGLSELTLLDGTVRDCVVSLETGVELGLSLLVGCENGALVVLSVHGALQTIV